MLQRREKENGLIKQIHCPSLLIRLIFQLPGVNYHTHTSRCCSTYIIITMAKTENNLKLKIWGLPPTSHTCTPCTHTYTVYTQHISHCNGSVINIFCLKPLGIFPNPLPSLGASCFWDWFHLFNDGCANDPSHTADGVTDTTASLEWGLDWGLESEG